MVTNLLARIAQADRRSRDFTLNNLRQALTEVIACFPVYRTYVAETPRTSDRRYIEWAVAAAKRRRSSSRHACLGLRAQRPAARAARHRATNCDARCAPSP